MIKNILLKIICFVAGHDNKILKLEHYLDTSHQKKGNESTYVVYKCLRCNKIYKKLYYDCGYLKEKDLVKGTNLPVVNNNLCNY